MAYIQAFITCGILCTIAQLLIFAHLKPPHILNIFMGLGGLLTPCGAMVWVNSFGGGGSTAVISGAGSAFTQAAQLAVQGAPQMLIVVAGLFFFTITIGICAGEFRYRRIARAEQEARERIAAAEDDGLDGGN